MNGTIPSLMETNVYSVKGRVLITGTCLPQVCIERTLPEHVPVEDYVVSDGKVVPVPDTAIELSKTLARLAMIAR